MKKTLLVFAAISCLAGSALAQDPTYSAPAKKGRLGAGLIVGLPIGDWGDFVDFSLGVLADFDYVVTPAISVTGRVGYLHHLEDLEDFSFYTIPIWAGIKYYFAPEGASTRFFAAPELALNLSGATVEFAGMSESETELDVGLNLGGGVELGAISIRAFLAILDLGNAGDSMELCVTGSYYFLAL